MITKLAIGRRGIRQRIQSRCSSTNNAATPPPGPTKEATRGITTSLNTPQIVKLPPLRHRLWNAYTESLEKRPLTTKCSAAALIFFSSDTAAQYIRNDDDDTNFSWDPFRALSGSFFGIVATSYLHFWWNGLEVVAQRVFPATQSKLKNAALKVFIDQSMGAPLYIYTYYTMTNFLQMVAEKKKETNNQDNVIKDAFTTSKKKADDMLWPTMLRHWQVWPIVHSLNFYYVPLQHRTLVQNLVLVGWSGYLSHLNNGGLITPKEEVEVTREIQRRQTLKEQAMKKRLTTQQARTTIVEIKNNTTAAAENKNKILSTSSNKTTATKDES